ncbi:hypothetical protein Ga0074812_108148 [Parafrankia irregularis]|uniref:Uncharacterized protein n=2 Tax=Frankiaceae TaxID=74712 RepID=A0A0S4QP97_9ACTN|nr:hypothetical protein Ga0074812_108148 [Parafrankia irregularis]
MGRDVADDRISGDAGHAGAGPALGGERDPERNVGAGPTEADRQAADHRYDFADDLDAMYEEYGDSTEYPELAERLERIRAQHAEYGDVFQKVLDGLLAELQAAAAELYPERSRDISGVQAVAAKEAAVVARYEPQSDDTGIIIIPTGLGVLLQQLIPPLLGLIGRRSDSFAGLLRTTRRISRGDAVSEDDALARAALLRFNLIHRRLWGRTATLGFSLDDRDTERMATFSTLAWNFALAHELAHHILGHGRHGAETGAAGCGGSPEMEYEADAVATRLVTYGARRDQLVMPVLGAYFVFAAIDVHERAILVRDPLSHPPAALRLRRVRKQFAAPFGRGFERLTGNLTPAVEKALNFGAPLGGAAWYRAYEHPQVSIAPRTPTYLEQISKLDLILAGPLDRAEAVLREEDTRRGTDLGAGLALLRAGRTGDGLRAWRISEKQITALIDPTRAASYPQLVRALTDGLQKCGFAKGETLCPAIVCANLLTPLLPTEGLV